MLRTDLRLEEGRGQSCLGQVMAMIMSSLQCLIFTCTIMMVDAIVEPKNSVQLKNRLRFLCTTISLLAGSFAGSRPGRGRSAAALPPVSTSWWLRRVRCASVFLHTLLAFAGWLVRSGIDGRFPEYPRRCDDPVPFTQNPSLCAVVVDDCRMVLGDLYLLSICAPGRKNYLWLSLQPTRHCPLYVRCWGSVVAHPLLHVHFVFSRVGTQGPRVHHDRGQN